MQHTDEEILKVRKQLEEAEKKRHSDETITSELQQSIYDEQITIYEVPVKFKEYQLLDDRISLWMPEDFEAMPEAIIKKIHPLGNPPQYLYGNDYLYFSIGFNSTTHQIPNSNVNDFVGAAENLLKRVGPNVKILKRESKVVDEHQVEILEMVSQAVDGALYNLMFYFSLDNTLQIGFINLPFKYNKRLRPIAKEILDSFHILKDKKEENK